MSAALRRKAERRTGLVSEHVESSDSTEQQVPSKPKELSSVKRISGQSKPSASEKRYSNKKPETQSSSSVVSTSGDKDSKPTKFCSAWRHKIKTESLIYAKL